MASLIHLDTHVVAWLYAGDVGSIPSNARKKMEHAQLTISPMVELELEYLFETGRTTQPGNVVVQDMVDRIGLAVSTVSFPLIVARAIQLRWTRDPFDRLIVAQSLVEGAVLVTGDRKIREHCRSVLWS